MVLSTETFNQSVRTEYSEAVNARYTFQPLWVSGHSEYKDCCGESSLLVAKNISLEEEVREVQGEGRREVKAQRRLPRRIDIPLCRLRVELRTTEELT